MMIEFIDLNDPENHYTFSSCAIAGDFIFTSHIAGFLDEEGNVLEGVAPQTAQCFSNLTNILAAAGAALDDVVKITVYLRDPKEFKEMREVYRQMFSHGYPARMTATSQFIDPRCRVMIEAIAYKPQG